MFEELTKLGNGLEVATVPERVGIYHYETIVYGRDGITLDTLRTIGRKSAEACHQRQVTAFGSLSKAVAEQRLQAQAEADELDDELEAETPVTTDCEGPQELYFDDEY